MSPHLTDEQLIGRLYGLDTPDAHLDSCEECARRWKEICERRAMLSANETVPVEFLAAQRRAIYARIEAPPGRARWAPLLAAALLAIGLLVYRPPAATPPDLGDAQLFSDVYSIGESTEPDAAVPIHGLFEDNQ